MPRYIVTRLLNDTEEEDPKLSEHITFDLDQIVLATVHPVVDEDDNPFAVHLEFVNGTDAKVWLRWDQLVALLDAPTVNYNEPPCAYETATAQHRRRAIAARK